jgi:phenylacetate-CoA ligase
MPARFLPQVRTLEELHQLQLRGLQWTVRHAYHGSPFYRQQWQQAGLTPEDVRSLDDLRRLPLVTASDLQDGYPFPLRAVPVEQIVRVHASSGTTGKKKVLCYTQRDLDDWAHFFARCFEMAGLTRADRVQLCVGYGLWTAGIGFQLACERFGMLTIPTGPGNLDMQCQFLEDFQTTVVCCTASMALLLAEEVHRRGLRERLHLTTVIYGAERASAAMRQRIKTLLGVEHLFDIPGLTELYGPGTGMECQYHQGIHYWADYYILELLDPETLEPVAEGEVGEMVVTTLRKEGAPLIRYRTRDLTRLLPGTCPCGSIMPRHDAIQGRSDDMVSFRGVNIYPSHVDTIISRMPHLGGEYRLILERQNGGRDSLTVQVERAADLEKASDVALVAQLGQAIKTQLLVTARVEVVDYGTLPRSERKSQRVVDRRSSS